MEKEEKIIAGHYPKIKDNKITGNYHQQQSNGEDQVVLIDQDITAETDELTLNQQLPPVDPENKPDPEDDQDNEEDDFPSREDLEEDDFDLNHDQDDDLSLNIDDEELN